jgi:hypothetical protein
MYDDMKVRAEVVAILAEAAAVMNTLPMASAVSDALKAAILFCLKGIGGCDD